MVEEQVMLLFFYVRFLLEILYLEDDLSEKESSLPLADKWSWTGVMSS